MTNQATLPEIGTEEFWVIYDEFVRGLEFSGWIDVAKENETCLKLQEILRNGHKSIAGLPRPERGWSNPKAWLVMRNEQIFNTGGNYVLMDLEVGDVMVREFGWDRDVFVTHTPIVERVSGHFLNQCWPGASKGLLLPLYDRSTIMRAIRTKVKLNAARCLDKAEEQARDWRWY